MTDRCGVGIGSVPDRCIGQRPDSYGIRLARADDIPRLRVIEDEAGTLFSGLGVIDETLDAAFPVEDLARLVRMEQVWVACPESNIPVGMVIASVREGAAYIEEMDVLPAHGRRGLGARLLACVCDWACRQGLEAVTLSTFRDVPWNGPFYRKHGFRDLVPSELTPGMRAIRDKEARHGLSAEARVFMRRELATRFACEHPSGSPVADPGTAHQNDETTFRSDGRSRQSTTRAGAIDAPNILRV